MHFVFLHGLDLEPYLLNLDVVDYITELPSGNTALYEKGKKTCFVCAESFAEVCRKIESVLEREVKI